MLIIVWGLTMHPAYINSGDQLAQNFVGQRGNIFPGSQYFSRVAITFKHLKNITSTWIFGLTLVWKKCHMS